MFRWKHVTRTIGCVVNAVDEAFSVLQADAAQIGKCCDPLESGMSTAMYSNRFCLISSIQWCEILTMWNDLPEWNLSNFTHNLDRSWGSRFAVKCSSHQPNLLNPDQKSEWLGWISTKGGGIVGITIEYWLYNLCTCTCFKWLNTIVEVKHVSRTLNQNCVVTTVHETLFYTLMQLKRANSVTPKTLNITYHRRVQAWNIGLYCHLTWCFSGATT